MQNTNNSSDAILEETLKPIEDNIREVIVDELRKNSLLSGNVLREDVSADDVKLCIKKLLDSSLEAVAGGGSSDAPDKSANGRSPVSDIIGTSGTLTNKENLNFSDSLTNSQFLEEHIADSLSSVWGGKGTVTDFIDREDLKKLTEMLSLSLKDDGIVCPIGAKPIAGYNENTSHADGDVYGASGKSLV